MVSLPSKLELFTAFLNSSSYNWCYLWNLKCSLHSVSSLYSKYTYGLPLLLGRRRRTKEAAKLPPPSSSHCWEYLSASMLPAAAGHPATWRKYTKLRPCSGCWVCLRLSASPPLSCGGGTLSSALAQETEPDLPASVPSHCLHRKDDHPAPSWLRLLSRAWDLAHSSRVLTHRTPHPSWLHYLPLTTLPIS